MKTFVLRLHPNHDLKKELIKFAKENKIKAGFVMTCVGSLRRATLRMADETVIKNFEKRFEINSLSGTLCQDDVHLHISLSDEKWKENPLPLLVLRNELAKVYIKETKNLDELYAAL